jgi:hypothetical protein
MDNLVRLTLYLILGAVLLFCNICYLWALRSLFASSDYVIMPIRVVGNEDSSGALGIALAQMLQARLKNIGESLADAQQQLPDAGTTAGRTKTAAGGADYLCADDQCDDNHDAHQPVGAGQHQAERRRRRGERRGCMAAEPAGAAA